MKKSELLLNPYKEHLKKPYLHGAGTLEIDGVQYSADEYITMLEEENRKLREFKEKREESMFYFKAQMERAEPKTAKEAEDLQKAKELFEGIYREELHYLEKENKELKENIKMLSGNIIGG